MTPGKPKMTEKPEEGEDHQQHLGTTSGNFGGKVPEHDIADWEWTSKREKGKTTMAITMHTMP